MTQDEGQLPEKVTLPAGSGEQGRAEKQRQPTIQQIREAFDVLTAQDFYAWCQKRLLPNEEGKA